MSLWHIYEKLWEEGLEEVCLHPLIAPKLEDSKRFSVWRASPTALALGTDSREGLWPRHWNNMVQKKGKGNH